MHSKSKQVDFENGRIAQNILGTALPMLVAQVLNLLYNIVDRIYIGRLPGIGTEALGAVGLCFPVIIIITAFTNMFGMGGSPLFSIEMGRGDHEKAGTILNTSFRLEVLSALFLTAAVELFTGRILLLFGAVQNQLIYAGPYLHIYMIGTIFSMIATGMNPFINAQGFSLIGMMTVVIGASANIILDPVFMFALRLGVPGAAIATVISQALSAGFVIRFFRGDKNAYPIRPWTKNETKHLPYAGRIITLGTAPFVMQVSNSLVSIACNSVLMKFGGEMYVSVMTIINSVRQVIDTPALALTDGASPTLSYNYGAGRGKNVRRAIAITTVMAIGYTFFMWLFIEWKPELLIGIFTNDRELQKLCLRPLHLYFLAFVCQSFQYSGQSVFKSLGKQKQAIFFSIFRKIVMVIPLTYLLPYVFGKGTDGVFMAEPISNAIGGTACFVTMLVTILPELKHLKQ